MAIVKIILEQAKRMDVVWGETAGVRGQLLLLCPILFTLQVLVLWWCYSLILCNSKLKDGYIVTILREN